MVRATREPISLRKIVVQSNRKRPLDGAASPSRRGVVLDVTARCAFPAAPATVHVPHVT